MRFDQNNPILPTEAITSDLLKQYIAQHAQTPHSAEKQISVGRPLADAMNGAPDFTSWGGSAIRRVVDAAMEHGHPEKAMQTIFVLAVLVGWELAQLHIENQMKATEVS